MTRGARNPNLQAPVVQKVDSAIQRINLYPLDSAIGFPDTYPLVSQPPVVQKMENAIHQTNHYVVDKY